MVGNQPAWLLHACLPFSVTGYNPDPIQIDDTHPNLGRGMSSMDEVIPCKGVM